MVRAPSRVTVTLVRSALGVADTTVKPATVKLKGSTAVCGSMNSEKRTTMLDKLSAATAETHEGGSWSSATVSVAARVTVCEPMMATVQSKVLPLSLRDAMKE